MRRLLTWVALGSAALCVVAASAALGSKGHPPKVPKQAAGSVSLAATPSTVTAATSAISVDGNLRSTSGCRKSRTVQFSYIGSGGATALSVTAVTGPNGDFAASLPKPTDLAPATVTLQATATETDRKVGSAKKGGRTKKGRKIICLAAPGQTTLTIAQ